jgi:L-aspartate oxidase
MGLSKNTWELLSEIILPCIFLHLSVYLGALIDKKYTGDKMYQTDALILGFGIAGASAALELAKAGSNIVIVSSGDPTEEVNSYIDQEGITYVADGDSETQVLKDLTNSAEGMCCSRAVEHLVSNARSCIDDVLINDLHISFERNGDGSFVLSQEQGHSNPRVLHCRDNTGQMILGALHAKLEEFPNVKILASHTAIELVTLAQHSLRTTDRYKKPACLGAYLLNQETDEVETVLAKETILATGGVAGLFLHNTAGSQATGCGIAMAKRSGARVMNLHQLLFNSTAFYTPNEQRFLLADALREQGAQLLSHRGAPFMERYHEKASAAPSTATTQALYKEMIDKQSDHLWLDLTNVDNAWVKTRYPKTHQHCMSKGFNLSKDFLPVVPVASYCNGGVAVDRVGLSSLQRLRAVGEVACTGIYGQKRLPGISLLEALVWGTSCGRDVAKQQKRFAYYLPEVAPWKNPKTSSDSTFAKQDWLTVKHIMWNHVGPLRHQRRLRCATALLRELHQDVEEACVQTQPSPGLGNLRNGIEAALLVAETCETEAEMV